MAEIRRTLIPQFSLRWLLAAMAVLAVASFVMSLALREQAWAAGLLFGLVSIVVVFAVYAATYGIAWIVAGALAGRRMRLESRDKPTNQQFSKSIARPDNIQSLLLAFLLCGLTAADAWGASGGAILLPLPTPSVAGGPLSKLPKPTSGLTMAIDTTWVDSFGYRPVRIQIASTSGPLTADRVLTVRCRAKSGYTNRDSATVTQSIEIPAGSTTATATIAIPQFTPMIMFEFDTFEDGQHIDELSIRTGWTSWSGTFQGDSASPVTLMLSGINTLTMPSIRMTTGVPPEIMYVGAPGITIAGVPVAGAIPGSAGTPVPSIASFADLPTNWIDYSGIDVMMVSLSQLQALIDQSPEQWTAIQSWLRNGGTLVVYGVGKKWQQIADLERLTSLDPSNAQSSADETNPLVRGWNLPKASQRNTPLEGSGGDAFIMNPDGTSQVMPANDETNVDRTAPPTEAVTDESKTESETAYAEKVPFVTHSCGLGAVVALRTDESFAGSNFDWAWMYNTLGSPRWQWFQRYGLSLYRPNEDFWNFLIPGVGLAPVTQFQVLITAFVLAIGPLNYWLLKRRGKLNLLVLTVPASAFLVTGALVLFALLSDGLSVRVRSRSFTRINQQRGEATCWARLSFYAGLAPGDGLKFADDTVVLPLEFAPRTDDSAPSRDLDWMHADPGNFKPPLQQRLTDGWLNSRTPTQFVTARIRKTAAKLDIRPGNAKEPPKVVNHLGSPILKLILVDNEGTYFAADETQNDAVASLAAWDEDHTALKEMAALLTDNQPRRPDSMVSHDNRSFFGLDRQRSYNQYMYGPGWNRAGSGNEAPPVQSTSILERSMATIQDQLLSGRLPARSYVAIVELSPEMQLGTPTAREEASFHVVVGSW